MVYALTRYATLAAYIVSIVPLGELSLLVRDHQISLALTFRLRILSQRYAGPASQGHLEVSSYEPL